MAQEGDTQTFLKVVLSEIARPIPILDTGASAVGRINDRGPYVHDRALEFSRRAAEALGTRERGLSAVRIEVL